MSLSKKDGNGVLEQEHKKGGLIHRLPKGKRDAANRHSASRCDPTSPVRSRGTKNVDRDRKNRGKVSDTRRKKITGERGEDQAQEGYRDPTQFMIETTSNSFSELSGGGETNSEEIPKKHGQKTTQPKNITDAGEKKPFHQPSPVTLLKRHLSKS